MSLFLWHTSIFGYAACALRSFHFTEIVLAFSLSTRHTILLRFIMSIKCLLSFFPIVWKVTSEYYGCVELKLLPVYVTLGYYL